jgi:hypothetical protein
VIEFKAQFYVSGSEHAADISLCSDAHGSSASSPSELEETEMHSRQSLSFE